MLSVFLSKNNRLLKTLPALTLKERVLIFLIFVMLLEISLLLHTIKSGIVTSALATILSV
jgi:hypothetical protein